MRLPHRLHRHRRPPTKFRGEAGRRRALETLWPGDLRGVGFMPARARSKTGQNPPKLPLRNRERIGAARSGRSAGRGRPLAALDLSVQQRKQLERLAHARAVSCCVALRARIILRCADGVPNKIVAREFATTPLSVGKWRKRYLEHGPGGLNDMPRPGRPRRSDERASQALLHAISRVREALNSAVNVRRFAMLQSISESRARRLLFRLTSREGRGG